MEAKEPDGAGVKEFDRKLMRLAGELLDMAADQFGNHGCNDWEWPAYFTPQERAIVAVQMVSRNIHRPEGLFNKDDIEEANHLALHGPMDYQMMRHLAELLKGGL